jgi:hypothetical protein
MTAPERIRARVRVDTNGCWIWQGARDRWDYGIIHNLPGRRPLAVGVHRVMYEHANGPIPDGLVIHHVCGVRLCCNPSHLDVETRGESNRRARRRA